MVFTWAGRSSCATFLHILFGFELINLYYGFNRLMFNSFILGIVRKKPKQWSRPSFASNPTHKSNGRHRQINQPKNRSSWYCPSPVTEDSQIYCPELIVIITSVKGWMCCYLNTDCVRLGYSIIFLDELEKNGTKVVYDVSTHLGTMSPTEDSDLSPGSSVSRLARVRLVMLKACYEEENFYYSSMDRDCNCADFKLHLLLLRFDVTTSTKFFVKYQEEHCNKKLRFV
jgi:hypothetical protein